LSGARRSQAAMVRRRGAQSGEPAPAPEDGRHWGLTWPHGDGSSPGVVERRVALAATPVGGTSTGGAATPVSALAGATAAVGGGNQKSA
jgi:hypothetical protein